LQNLKLSERIQLVKTRFFSKSFSTYIQERKNAQGVFHVQTIKNSRSAFEQEGISMAWPS